MPTHRRPGPQARRTPQGRRRAAALLAAVLLAAIGLLGGCETAPSAAPSAGREGAGAPVTLLPLAGGLEAAELSGLAWWGDWLVLLPQTPGQFAPAGAAPGEGRVFALHRDSLLAALDARAAPARPLQPRAVPFLAPGVAEAVPDFDGYEALAFRGDTAVVTIETGHSAPSMQGFLVQGLIAQGRAGPPGRTLDTLRLDARTMATLPAQASINNFSYEALVAGPQDVLALYENNGQARNPTPEAARFSIGLQPLPALSFPRLEYRLTDATTVDAQGRFWVTNYYWPGDSTSLQPGPSVLAPPPRASDGSKRPLRKRRVEQLVELKRTGGAVALSGRAPIRLRLDSSGRSRNWEGLARLPGRGFLLATDEYPRTLLGFVAEPPGRALPHRTARPAWLAAVETLLAVLAGLAVALLGLLAARHPGAAWRLTRERFRRGTAYGLSLTVAAVFVGGAFWIFTEVVEAWTQPGALDQVDAWANGLAQAWAAPGLHTAMLAATRLGSGWAAGLIVGAVALWLYRRHARAELAVLLVGFGTGEALVFALKTLFHRTRPAGGLSALGASFPSGHAFTAFLTYGLLAYLLWRVPTLRRWRYAGMALLVLVILLVGVSRIYLRAHYLTDVAGGFVLAAGWLAAAVALTSVLRARVGR